MHRILRGCPWIKKAERADVKQSVIVGILRAFKTIRPEERPEYIPLRVISYVRHELNVSYLYLRDEDGKTLELDVKELDTKTFTPVDPQLDAILFATSDIFSKEDMAVLYRKYVLAETHYEIAEALGIGWNTVRRVLHKCRNIVSQNLQKDGTWSKRSFKKRRCWKRVQPACIAKLPDTGEHKTVVG